ncbi:MAG: type II toxin-antitoxin system VapC family toxin [Sphingopyxis sp.]|nr:type II toxin-antitoxin system VapC family toxin [Sphingopyxis sp.]
MPFVVDASVAIAWILPDENNYRPLELAEQLGTGQAIVPHHWYSEVANALLTAERRRRITPAETTQFLGFLIDLGVETDSRPGRDNIASIITLAREHGLTVYDAIYLELAMRSGRALATLDHALRRAAATVGVKIIP